MEMDTANRVQVTVMLVLWGQWIKMSGARMPRCMSTFTVECQVFFAISVFFFFLKQRLHAFNPERNLYPCNIAILSNSHTQEVLHITPKYVWDIYASGYHIICNEPTVPNKWPEYSIWLNFSKDLLHSAISCSILIDLFFSSFTHHTLLLCAQNKKLHACTWF